MSAGRYFNDMKYALAFLFVLIILGVFAVSNLIVQPASPDAQSVAAVEQYSSILARVKSGNIFAPYFTEPFETMILLVRDGRYYSFTTHHGRRILVPPSYVCEYLRREGIEPCDIVIIIHNHPDPCPFTPGDNYFYHYFKRQGFKGSFVIYYPFSGDTLVKED